VSEQYRGSDVSKTGIAVQNVIKDIAAADGIG
jgi:hypothetical protein